MKIMNIPGFTAETSLYNTGGHYQVTSSSYRLQLDANLVKPSLAIYMDGRFVCDGDVTANGFINCYPPPSSGDAPVSRDRAALFAIASCYRKCKTKPLAQREACRAGCDDL
jgi:hypothetical protein